MIVLGLLLMALAVGLAIDVVVENTARFNLDAVNHAFRWHDIPLGWIFLAGAATAAVFWIGLGILLAALRRTARRRAERRQLVQAANRGTEESLLDQNRQLQEELDAERERRAQLAAEAQRREAEAEAARQAATEAQHRETELRQMQLSAPAPHVHTETEERQVLEREPLAPPAQQPVVEGGATAVDEGPQDAGRRRFFGG